MKKLKSPSLVITLVKFQGCVALQLVPLSFAIMSRLTLLLVTLRPTSIW